MGTQLHVARTNQGQGVTAAAMSSRWELVLYEMVTGEKPFPDRTHHRHLQNRE